MVEEVDEIVTRLFLVLVEEDFPEELRQQLLGRLASSPAVDPRLFGKLPALKRADFVSSETAAQAADQLLSAIRDDASLRNDLGAILRVNGRGDSTGPASAGAWDASALDLLNDGPPRSTGTKRLMLHLAALVAVAVVVALVSALRP